MDSRRFAMIPLEMLRDRRLSLEQLRVLIALLSFASKDSAVVFPRRQSIAELTGMHLANISSATSVLESLGWLTKDGKGGYSKATRYTITIPNTVAQSATVAERATVWQMVRTNGDDSTWELMPAYEFPKLASASRPRFQLFTSGLAARHTFLLDSDSGKTWTVAAGKRKGRDGVEFEYNAWQPFAE